MQRIMLIDGPAVLGWAEWRAMDEAALWLATSSDPAALPQTLAALDRLLDGLKRQD